MGSNPALPKDFLFQILEPAYVGKTDVTDVFQEMKTTDRCIYCQSSEVLEKPGFLICRNCNSLSSTEPEIVYTGTYHAYKVSWLRPKIYFLRAKAKRCGLKGNQTVADIGCGAGHALFWAKRSNCQTVGFDIPDAASHVGNVDRFYSDLDTLSKKEAAKCDLVWCWHTIEHTNEPAALIETAFAILKPGGMLYLEFPESNLLQKNFPDALPHWAVFPEHRGIPSKEWATKASQGIGFSLIQGESPNEGRWLYSWRPSMWRTPNFHWRLELAKPK